MAASKTRSASKTAARKGGSAHQPTPKTVMKTTNTRAKPIAEMDDRAHKDMSPEAVSARRSAAQKAAVRMARVSTAEARAADIKVATAKGNEQTVYEALKDVWSAKGEILTKVGSNYVEVKKADLVRQLKQLPRDAKTPFKVTASPTDDLVHILA